MLRLDYKKIAIHALPLALLMGGAAWGLTGCGNADGRAHKDAAQTSADHNFTMPQPPSTLTNSQERAAYVAERFWQSYDFADTTLVASEVTEQAVADFLNIAALAAPASANEGIRAAMAGSIGNEAARYRFAELFEHYLYDPNSPMRNEALYEMVVDYILASTAIPDIEKVRPRLHKKQIDLNRPGTIANDFTFVPQHGGVRWMHRISAQYTLIYFYNPDCADCREVKQQIASSQLLLRLQMKNALKILAIYPDKDIEAWIEYSSEIPDGWQNGHTDHLELTLDPLYDLRAIPSLYLLDKDKRVLLKDAPFDRIESELLKLSN